MVRGRFTGKYVKVFPRGGADPLWGKKVSKTEGEIQIKNDSEMRGGIFQERIVA